MEQVPALVGTAASSFVTRAVAHLRGYFPSRCAHASDQELEALVRDGLARASLYGLVSERDVCKLLNLMMVLGPGFDQDPELPWVRQHLDDAAHRGPSLQLDRLYRAAVRRCSSQASSPARSG